LVPGKVPARAAAKRLIATKVDDSDAGDAEEGFDVIIAFGTRSCPKSSGAPRTISITGLECYCNQARLNPNYGLYKK